MIGRVFRLMDTKRIEMKLRNIELCADSVIIKPDYLSICAADERYYFGKRSRAALMAKLPMALIHEAVGTVLYDSKGELEPCSKVVLVPLETTIIDSDVKSNYCKDNVFASSGADGFMRDFVSLPHSRVIPIEKDYSISYALCELFSVAVGAVGEFEKNHVTPAESFGVWGDGSMGFVIGLALRAKYPNANIYVFGKTERKLNKLSFATQSFFIDQLPDDLTINHAFECVGGNGSESAIKQIIDIISPQGTIGLLGVNEELVPINTRMVLEKGLRLVGNSRSDYADFAEAIRLIDENEDIKRYLRMLVSEVIEIKTEGDIPYAFEQSKLNDFKTVMKWSI